MNPEEVEFTKALREFGTFELKRAKLVQDLQEKKVS